MGWTQDELDAAIDARVVDLISLHTDNPGASGTNNEVSGGGYARKSVTFGAAVDGVRTMTANVTFDGPATTVCTYMGYWENDATPIFKGSEILDGDAADRTFDGDGELVIRASDTKLTAENKP